MDGIRAVAIAYYDRATRGEKDLVEQYFNRFNINVNGKITLQQFKNVSPKYLSDENIFRKLDSNGDGALEKDDIICLYYMENKLGLHKCAACRDLLVGAYFSCLRCVEDRLDAECRLCCACYHLGGFTHEHSLSNFLDQHSMAKELKNHTPEARRDLVKRELEELRLIAKSYYLAGSQEVQKLAHEFFDSMDMDRDGKVDLSEFMEFMKEEGYTQMQNPKFFRELDFDGNGTLDFNEVMTAYYITKSGRPFCDQCGDFIRGIYFSCVKCYRNPKSSFNLCCNCYRSKKCAHKHDGQVQFLDNFALLEAMKDSADATTQANKSHDEQNQAKSPVPANSQASRSPVVSKDTKAKSQVPSHTTTVPAANHTTSVIYNTFVMNPPPPVTNYYNAVVRPPHRNQWMFALKALEAAMAIGSIATTAAMCTIM